MTPHPALEPAVWFAAGLALYAAWHAVSDHWHHHRPRRHEREKGAR